MSSSRIINRYNAYYRGWCLAFGDHDAEYEQEREVNWLNGEDKIGLILSSGLRKQFQRVFLSQAQDELGLVLSNDVVKMREFAYRINTDIDRVYIQRLRDFLLNSDDLHMFLSSHFFYQGERIITFANKKPLPIMYKMMEPINLTIK